MTSLSVTTPTRIGTALLPAAPASSEQKALLQRLTPEQIQDAELAGEKIETMLTTAPGNGTAIGGLKVITKSGWFAARPSGTEEIYKIYAESFRGTTHLQQIQEEAQSLITKAFTATSTHREVGDRNA